LLRESGAAAYQISFGAAKLFSKKLNCDDRSQSDCHNGRPAHDGSVGQAGFIKDPRRPYATKPAERMARMIIMSLQNSSSSVPDEALPSDPPSQR
jgi:hypothetical protein